MRPGLTSYLDVVKTQPFLCTPTLEHVSQFLYAISRLVTAIVAQLDTQHQEKIDHHEASFGFGTDDLMNAFNVSTQQANFFTSLSNDQKSVLAYHLHGLSYVLATEASGASQTGYLTKLMRIVNFLNVLKKPLNIQVSEEDSEKFVAIYQGYRYALITALEMPGVFLLENTSVETLLNVVTQVVNEYKAYVGRSTHPLGAFFVSSAISDVDRLFADALEASLKSQLPPFIQAMQVYGVLQQNVDTLCWRPFYGVLTRSGVMQLSDNVLVFTKKYRDFLSQTISECDLSAETL